MMKMQILGLVNLVWEAPGNHTDSDGSVRKNVLWFSGIEPREVFNITSEEFTTISGQPCRQLGRISQKSMID
mgnify:CR=1 FL=1